MPRPTLCKQPGCIQEVAQGHFLCVHHWACLPKRIQQGMMLRVHGWRNECAAVDFLRDYQRATGALKGGVL